MDGGLGLDEASELAHALVARVLADAGIRSLFLKGPVATRQGLRPPQTSTDVDVLCDPGRIARAESAFDALGWERYHGRDSDMRAVRMHATTYCIPGWPCTVDVHNHFPGLLAPAQEAFEHLWADRVEVDLAHRPVPTPCPEDHFVVLGVHLLRGLAEDGEASAVELVCTAWDGLGPTAQARVPDRARALGAVETLRPLIESLGADIGPLDERFEEALGYWRLHRARPGDPGVVWAERWRRSTWRHRPELVARAFWDISMDNTRTPQQWAAATRFERAAGRVRRAGRGLRATPAAVRAILASWSARRERRAVEPTNGVGTDRQ